MTLRCELHPVLSPEGVRVALLGNEAIVRGALEAGLSVAAAYPGTPSTEIGETLSKIAKEAGVYFEWSANEKVATEVAAAAAWSGVRSMTMMKHVGFNVASDAIFTLAYAGVKAGMVIVSADDPSAHSSQNEQDNRYYAFSTYLPMLEPSTSQEAKDITKEAFELSEKYRVPFIVRTTTRLSHSRGPVLTGPLTRGKGEGYFMPENWDDYLQVGAIARKHHKRLIETVSKIEKELSADQRFNQIEGDGDVGILTSGVSYNYVYEALRVLNVEAKVLKMGLTYPVSYKVLGEFLEGLHTAIVVEELEPYLELNLMAASKEYNPDVKIYGKLSGHFPRVAEYTPLIVVEGIAKILGVSLSKDVGPNPIYKDVEAMVPPRPPVLCPACPHRATGYVLRKVTRKFKDTIFVGDIGCYALLFQKPFQVEHITHAMGSSIGFANGFSQSTRQPIVALIGDSTFFHAGIPALLNAVHNKHRFLTIILDNRITAMTGHQSHPGVPYDAMGREAPALDIEAIVKSLGVDYVRTVDPYNFRELEEAIRGGLEHKGVSVVIARRECALLTVGRLRRKGERIVPYRVNPEKCTHCKVCISTYSCPAFKDAGEKVEIDPAVCFGCGSCVPVCPFNAIEPIEGARPWFKGGEK